MVVTNAHVVAGETDTTVQVGGGPPNLSAQVIDFDPHDDVAVLSVPSLGRRPLALAGDPRPGAAAAILGYPLDGPFTAVAGRIGPTQTVSTQDAYGNGPVLRRIQSLRGLVRPGNSGGPLVDSAGHVVGTVFASITGGTVSPGGDGLAVPNSIVRRQLAIARSRGHSVNTGPCAG
jgi:S1-C subfamily serine protease